MSPRDLFVYVEKKIPKFKGRIVVLDGTGRKVEVDALFERDFKVFDGSVSLEGCTKVFIRRAMGKTKSKKMSDDQLTRILKQAFGELRPTDEKILIGTHLGIEERIGDLSKRLFPKKIIETTHFGANRGVNKFESFDVFIGLGGMTINQVSALDMAMVLFKERVKRDEWMHWRGESDLLQTVHRIRPILARKTIILVGRYWPRNLGQPSYTIDTRRGNKVADQSFSEAYSRACRFVSQNGFLTKDIAWGLGIGSRDRDRDDVLAVEKTIKQALPELAQLEEPPQKGAFYLIHKILLSREHLFEGVNAFSISPAILLNSSRFWFYLLERLQEDFPELPSFETAQGPYKGQMTKGIGSKRSVMDFWECWWSGLPEGEFKNKMKFDEKMWSWRDAGCGKSRF